MPRNASANLAAKLRSHEKRFSMITKIYENLPLSPGTLLHKRNCLLGQKSGIRRKAPTNIIIGLVLTNEAIQRSTSTHKASVDLDIRAKSKAIVILF